MIDFKKYNDVMKNLPEGVSEAEIDIEYRGSTLIKYSGGEVTETLSSSAAELFTRASGEKTGYAYTQDLCEDPKDVLMRALRNSFPVERMQKDELNWPSIDKKIFRSDEEKNPDITSMKSMAKDLEKYIWTVEPNIIDVAVDIRAENFLSHVINSYGLDVTSVMNIYCISASVVAEKNGNQYNASFYESVPELPHLNFNKFGEKISAGLKHQYDAVEIESGEYKVVLDSSVVTNIMMTSWQLFSGMKYNDGSSALSGKLGEIIGSGSFSLIDTPSHELTGYNYKFDCEGTPSKRQILMDKGKFVGLMHNISSASKIAASPTGNAGRYALLSGSIPTDIIITPKIIHVIPGKKSLAEMLKDMGNGIYITESYDVFHSINIGSGEFSIPCRGAVIKNGKEDHNVTGMTMCGKLIDLFKSVISAGNDLYIEEFLRKSYCVGGPSLLIEKLQINGE